MSYLSWLYRWSHGVSPKLSQSLPKLIGGAGTPSLGWTGRPRVQGEAVSRKRGTSREVHGTSAFLALSWEQPTALLKQTSAGPDNAQSERCDGTRFTFGLSWRSDSMWIRACCLDIKGNDRSCFGHGQVLIAKCWRQNRSWAVWSSSTPQTHGSGLNSFGDRWKYRRVGALGCVLRRHLDISLTAIFLVVCSTRLWEMVNYSFC